PGDETRARSGTGRQNRPSYALRSTDELGCRFAEEGPVADPSTNPGGAAPPSGFVRNDFYQRRGFQEEVNTKTQRKAPSIKFEAAFLCVFVSLCLCAFVFLDTVRGRVLGF